MKFTLGKKIGFSSIALALVPMIGLGVYCYFSFSSALLREASETVMAKAGGLSDVVEESMKDETRMVGSLAVNPLVVAAATKIKSEGAASAAQESATVGALFKIIRKEFEKDYEAVFLTDSADGKVTGASLKGRKYFQPVMDGKTVARDVVHSTLSGLPVATVVVPIKDPAGVVVGAVGAAVNIDRLVQKISSTRLGDTGYAFMSDADGLIIAHKDKDLILKLKIQDLKGFEGVVSRAMNGESGVAEYEYNGASKIGAFRPVALNGWCIFMTQEKSDFLAAVTKLRQITLIITGVILGLAALAATLLTRSITRPLIRMTEGLNEAAEQMGTASTEVAGSSQRLAEGASQQAAAIEETSASLEEMSSMTRQNADNAAQAHKLSTEADALMTKADGAMSLLTGSMREIHSASEETRKIVRTIDEIAFQTNLLALNAAVEAARAGEAGAGFAVVADEVRNLALRAAEAARNTTDLIEGTVHKIGEGVELVSAANRSFSQVVKSSKSIGELAGEIAAASSEQAQGIAQIDKAVSEMDTVVQRNAGNAEESAAAAEEMSAQAQCVKNYVEELATLVNGSGAVSPATVREVSARTRPSRRGPAGRGFADARPMTIRSALLAQE